MKLRQRILNNMLERDGLVAVPKEWQKEYVKLAGEKVNNFKTIDVLVDEYNSLLKDYYSKCSIKDLKDALKDADIDKPITKLSKDELIEEAVKEYKMYHKKD